MPAIKVRAGRFDDAVAIWTMLVRDMAPEMGAGQILPAVSPNKVFAAVLRCLSHGFVAVADDGADLVGAILCEPSQTWYSEEWMLAELALYVRPEVRQGAVARRLIAAARSFAKERQARLTIGVIGGRDVERKAAFFDRCGLELTGVVFQGE